MENRRGDSGMTFKEKLKKIIEKYGEDGQIAKTLEELVELSEVLVKYLNKGELDRDHLIEEMADVDVMMAQLMIIFDIDTESYQDEISKKIDRTLERMKQEPDCPWK